MAVTTVPEITASANNTPIPDKYFFSLGEQSDTGFLPSRACRHSTTAFAISTMESKKCPMFANGFRPVSTTIPPSTTWANTPTTSPSERRVSERFFSTRNKEPKTAAMTMTATKPVNSRLICSMAPCIEDTSMNFSELHCGQSLQPKPEPVRRTSPPVTTMAKSDK